MKLSNLFLRLAVLFVLTGVGLGYWMGVPHQFLLSPVHAHINLLGWVSMFLYGLFYRIVPEASAGWLPNAHAVLAIVGLPVMMAMVPPMMLAGPTLVVLGMVAFAAVVFRATGDRWVAA